MSKSTAPAAPETPAKPVPAWAYAVADDVMALNWPKTPARENIARIAMKHAPTVPPAAGVGELVDALRESSSLLAFLHGAFGNKLKPADAARMTLAHRNNRAALSVIQPRLSADKLALEKVAGLSTCGERGLFLDKRNSRDLDLDMAIELARTALKSAPPAVATKARFSCFRCDDGNTPLYCLNCASELVKPAAPAVQEQGAGNDEAELDRLFIKARKEPPPYTMRQMVREAIAYGRNSAPPAVATQETDSGDDMTTAEREASFTREANACARAITSEIERELKVQIPLRICMNIVQAIGVAMDAAAESHSPDCDSLDKNLERIVKPCNCMPAPAVAGNGEDARLLQDMANAVAYFEIEHRHDNQGESCRDLLSRYRAAMEASK